MKIRITYLLTALLTTLSLPVTAETEVEITTAKRTDNFQWNIAGTCGGGHYSNRVSELTWRDVESTVTGLAIKHAFKNELIFIGHFNYGETYSGRNQDSDYEGNDGTGEFLRSYSDSNYGYNQDISGALAKRIKSSWGSHSLITLLSVGFSYSQQGFRMSSGIQAITDTSSSCYDPGFSNPGDRFPDLDSSYTASWYGPFAGIDLLLSPHQSKNKLRLSAEYHLAHYYAEANWNLRLDLKHPLSFTHESDSASGVMLGLGYDMSLTEKWSLEFFSQYDHWKSESGPYRIYYSNNTEGLNVFNGADLETIQYGLKLSRYF